MVCPVCVGSFLMANAPAAAAAAAAGKLYVLTLLCTVDCNLFPPSATSERPSRTLCVPQRPLQRRPLTLAGCSPVVAAASAGSGGAKQPPGGPPPPPPREP